MPDINTIDTLKSSLVSRNGLAKPTQFNILFTLPPGIPGASYVGRNLDLMCQGTALPTRTVETMEYSGTQRHPYAIPTGLKYDTIAFKFLVANDFFPKNIFDAWMNLVIDSKSYRIRYAADYATDISVHQEDGQGNSIYGVKLIQAFPTAISDIELDSGATDQVHMISVTFAYYEYESMDNTSLAAENFDTSTLKPDAALPDRQVLDSTQERQETGIA